MHGLRVVLAISAVLGVLAATGAARAGTADGLRTILAFVPAGPTPGGSVDYTDLSAAAAITGKRGLQAVLALSRRLALQSHGDILGQSEAWPDKAGFALAEVQALAAAGAPPNAVQFFRLAPAVNLERLEKAWAGRGYRATAHGTLALWARGRAGALDLSRRDPDDPFGGVLGRASVLLPALPIVAESFAAASLQAAAAARASGGLAARADVAAVLGALDQTGGRLLQAVLLPEPATAMTARGGIAPYSALLIADLAQDQRAEVLVMLAYGDCAAAGAAETAIRQRWSAQEPQIAALAPAWRMQAGGGACVLVGVAAEPAPDAAFYRMLLHALYARRLSALEMRTAR